MRDALLILIGAVPSSLVAIAIAVHSGRREERARNAAQRVAETTMLRDAYSGLVHAASRMELRTQHRLNIERGDEAGDLTSAHHE